ncbi:hypothetical protein [Chryseobacterium sp. OSA05B]|uniref:hypothetical protein n=1 Tax=Chryseobacterium sp. OSA05B TaxID=2862650 RepID=UPI001CBDDE3D|nr:hypothetical protein [Chryseobacterium sp. OSA05B]
MKNIDIRYPANIGTADIDVYNAKANQLFTDQVTLEFFRSKTHSEGAVGSKDTDYQGTFGFDAYNSKIMPRGAISNYLDIEGKEIQTSDNPKYISPYLSIYPPEFGDSKSKITLYIKATDKKKGTTGEVEFSCVSSKGDNKNTNINIVGNNKILLESGSAKPLTLQCIKPFKDDIFLEARSGTKKIGQIVIKANAKIYETTIQPVMINWGTTASKSVELVDHESLVENIAAYFNTNSLNQAYIKGNLAKKTHSVTFLKSDFTKDSVLKEIAGEEDPCGNTHTGGLFVNYGNKGSYVNANSYNDLVEERYAALGSGNKEKQDAKEKIQQAIVDLITVFKKDFKYDKQSNLEKAKSFHKDAKVTNIWKKPEVVSAYKKYEDLRKSYKGNVELDRKNTIYIFINKNIEGGRDPITKVQAYSLQSSGVVHIFNSAYTDKDGSALIIHEVGHSLSLNHTFTDEKLNALNKNTETINKLKKEKDELENTKKNLDLKNYYGIDKKYLTIQKLITYSEDKSKPEVYYFERDFLFNIIGKAAVKDEKPITGVIDIENRPNPTSDISVEDEIAKRDAEIKRLTEENKKLKNETGVMPPSKTLENIMDYRQGTDSTCEKPYNENFQYKVFYERQWKAMVDTGIEEGYINEIKQKTQAD